MLKYFWRAKLRKNKGAVKLHTVLDIKTEILSFIHISAGKTHEVNVLDIIELEVNGYFIMDKGFVDFKRLCALHLQKAYFITRAKIKMKCRRIYSAKVDKTQRILYDQTIKLINYYVLKDYPEKLRRIKYYDIETKKTFIFLTNNFELTALEIALLSRYRWRIELFFKWIKQHLKAKSFWGIQKMLLRFKCMLQ